LVYFKKKCIFAEKSQQMVKVSVILPIYNVAPYLDETFQSLLTQTLKEIEIIAVNDGSTDNSEEIIQKYQNQDPRIISISQENLGLSDARNTALRLATGQYIFMMDSDDILSHSDALKMCFEYAEKKHADFIFFDGERFRDGTYEHISDIQRTHLAEENTPYDGQDLLNLMLDHNTHNSAVWLLLINHDFMNRQGLRFYSGIIHEDELFTTILTLSSNAIFCLKKSLVRHRIRSTSIMGTHISKHNLECYLIVSDELLKFSHAPIVHKYLQYTLSKVFYTGHLIPFRDKPVVFWRALRSGYLKYIGVKSTLVFWLKA
jgi:glycosyltransferase involved in cell wall biosynthesis